MHLRKAERNIGLQVTVKLYKFVHQRCIVQVLKPATCEFSLCLYPRIFVEAVVATKIVFIEQQVHLPTALAAEAVVFT